MRGSRGGGGGRGSEPQPEKLKKNIGFLSNTGPDPLKITKLLSQLQCWVIIGTPAKRHSNGVSLVGRFKWYLDPPIN